MSVNHALLAALAAGTVGLPIVSQTSGESKTTPDCVEAETKADHKPDIPSAKTSPHSASPTFALDDLAQGVMKPNEAWRLIGCKRSRFYYLQQKGNKRYDPTFPQPGHFDSGRPFYLRIHLLRWLQAQNGHKTVNGGM